MDIDILNYFCNYMIPCQQQNTGFNFIKRLVFRIIVFETSSDFLSRLNVSSYLEMRMILWVTIYLLSMEERT